MIVQSATDLFDLHRLLIPGGMARVYAWQFVKGSLLLHWAWSPFNGVIVDLPPGGWEQNVQVMN